MTPAAGRSLSQVPHTSTSFCFLFCSSPPLLPHPRTQQIEPSVHRRHSGRGPGELSPAFVTSQRAVCPGTAHSGTHLSARSGASRGSSAVSKTLEVTGRTRRSPLEALETLLLPGGLLHNVWPLTRAGAGPAGAMRLEILQLEGPPGGRSKRGSNTFEECFLCTTASPLQGNESAREMNVWLFTKSKKCRFSVRLPCRATQ